MKYKKTPCPSRHGVFLCTNCGIEPQVPVSSNEYALKVLVVGNTFKPKVLVVGNTFKPKVLVATNTFIIYR